jgi:hypothetical protein
MLNAKSCSILLCSYRLRRQEPTTPRDRLRSMQHCAELRSPQNGVTILQRAKPWQEALIAHFNVGPIDILGLSTEPRNWRWRTSANS